MTTHIECNDGLTFAGLAGEGDFPTVETFRRGNAYAWSGYGRSWHDLPDFLLSWFVVLHDPRSVRYFDEDRETMDRTNFDVLAEILPDDVPSLYSLSFGYGESAERRAEESARDDEETAREIGAAWLGRVLLVSPDNEEVLDHVRECARSLSDYPLLDESAYSDAEWDAWNEYAPTAWSDEIRWPADADADRMVSLLGEDWRDVLDEMDAEEVLSSVSPFLHYWGGFSGEYGPSFLSLLADLVETDSSHEYRGRAADEVRDILDRARRSWESVEPAEV